MFDGVPEQFHQFITPRTSLPLHLPFPLHHASATPNTTTFPAFDPYNPSSHPQLPLQPTNLLHPLHPASTHKHEQEKEENTNTVPMNFEIDQRDQRRHQLPQFIDPSWTNDEVLALLRIRSSMESWFPDFTWEHVSRKLAEVGYKRSAEKCKEKFEEESRYFNNINYPKSTTTNNNNYRFVSELEELYQGGSDHTEGQDKMDHHAVEEDSRNDTKEKEKSNEEVENLTKEKKRKRVDKFEVFKGFCESIVHKMMAQQEEMHNKLIEDMLRRDEEKFTREEAWKKQEMDKMNKELEIMAHEQAIAGDRQANIIEFLKNFSAISPLLSAHESSTLFGEDKLKVTTTTNGSTSSNPNNPLTSSSSPLQSQNPNPPSTMIQNNVNPAENPSSSTLSQDTLLQLPPSSSTSAPVPINPSLSPSLETNSVANNRITTTDHQKDDVGRRWPKDEVLALINLRCTSLNSNNEEKEGNNNNNKAPLWERISQGMLELGYKRSAKRCKEKWENINKYFRKTKDANKKRSIDSRTCPYFHQLSNLYNQGKLVIQTERPEISHMNNNSNSNNNDNPAEQVLQDQTQPVGSGGDFTMQQQQKEEVDHHHGGEKNLMQVPAASLDFDQF